MARRSSRRRSSALDGLMTGCMSCGIVGLPNALIERAESAAVNGIVERYDRLSLLQKLLVGAGLAVAAYVIIPKLWPAQPTA